jgi:hypothetical protein
MADLILYPGLSCHLALAGGWGWIRGKLRANGKGRKVDATPDNS